MNIIFLPYWKGHRFCIYPVKSDMWFWISVICLGFYLFCGIWFLCGSALQLHLLWHAKRKGSPATRAAVSSEGLPQITIQVPVYNERFVIARLLASLGTLDYPRHLFDIQVLDDSTDDTSVIIDQAVHTLQQKEIAVYIRRRKDRKGYKAGALQEGLPFCSGELIAIFDADFIPKPDFLKRMVTYFSDAAVGGVQGRWTHYNLNENPLTVIQSFLLDSHFNLEQTGRSAAGYFLNFNGTAGIWRKQCILDSGGWNGEILTEDLELSYRAQLKGWKFLYDNEITVPAELPADMNAFKSQQFRWAKGMAQTASKHLHSIHNTNVPAAKKIHAVFHLLSSLSFLAIMGNILMAAPILAARNYYPEFRQLSNIIMFTGITLPIICTYYYFGTITTLPRRTFWKYLPLFLVIYLALSVQNSIAVIQGLFGHVSPFVRTPKSSGTNQNTYAASQWTFINWFEVFIATYITGIIIFSVYWLDYLLVLFLLMTLIGLIILTVPALRRQLIPVDK